MAGILRIVNWINRGKNKTKYPETGNQQKWRTLTLIKKILALLKKVRKPSALLG